MTSSKDIDDFIFEVVKFINNIFLLLIIYKKLHNKIKNIIGEIQNMVVISFQKIEMFSLATAMIFHLSREKDAGRDIMSSALFSVYDTILTKFQKGFKKYTRKNEMKLKRNDLRRIMGMKLLDD